LNPLLATPFLGRGIIIVTCSFMARVIRKALFSAANRKKKYNNKHNKWYVDIDMPSSFFNCASWLSCVLEDMAMFWM
jgi:hypothetical protein